VGPEPDERGQPLRLEVVGGSRFDESLSNVNGCPSEGLFGKAS
jgi:hypothetical protein